MVWFIILRIKHHFRVIFHVGIRGFCISIRLTGDRITKNEGICWLNFNQENIFSIHRRILPWSLKINTENYTPYVLFCKTLCLFCYYNLKYVALQSLLLKNNRKCNDKHMYDTKVFMGVIKMFCWMSIEHLKLMNLAYRIMIKHVSKVY